MVAYPRNMTGVLVVGLCGFMALESWSWNRGIAGVLVVMGVFRLFILVRDLQRKKSRRE